MRKLLALFVLSGAAASAQNSVFAQQTQQPSIWNRFVLGGSFDVTGVNGPVIRKFGDLALSPKFMSGSGATVEFGYQATRNIRPFVGYQFVQTHGTGLWQPNSNNQQEQSAGVTGTAQGTVRAEAQGFQAGTYYTLLRHRNWQLSVKGGIIMGHRWTDFTGSFCGFDGQDNFCVPASDHQSDRLVQPIGAIVLGLKPGGPVSFGISVGFGIAGAQAGTNMFVGGKPSQ